MRCRVSPADVPKTQATTGLAVDQQVTLSRSRSITDPKKVSYATLVAAFFASQDPTTLNRQGADVGTEYRSMAFYRTEAEKKILVAEADRINASGKYKTKVVTEIVPFRKFNPGEAYHQEYIARNPGTGYVRSVSIHDFIKFKGEFKGNYKP